MRNVTQIGRRALGKAINTAAVGTLCAVAGRVVCRAINSIGHAKTPRTTKREERRATVGRWTREDRWRALFGGGEGGEVLVAEEIGVTAVAKFGGIYAPIQRADALPI
eukprot:jgi/Bigna1/125386/aug1.1_g94